MASKVYELFKAMHDGVKFGEIIKFYFGSIRILHCDCIIKIIQRRRFFSSEDLQCELNGLELTVNSRAAITVISFISLMPKTVANKSYRSDIVC